MKRSPESTIRTALVETDVLEPKTRLTIEIDSGLAIWPLAETDAWAKESDWIAETTFVLTSLID